MKILLLKGLSQIVPVARTASKNCYLSHIILLTVRAPGLICETPISVDVLYIHPIYLIYVQIMVTCIYNLLKKFGASFYNTHQYVLIIYIYIDIYRLAADYLNTHNKARALIQTIGAPFTPQI